MAVDLDETVLFMWLIYVLWLCFSTAKLAPAMGNVSNLNCQIECDELDGDFNSR